MQLLLIVVFLICNSLYAITDNITTQNNSPENNQETVVAIQTKPKITFKNTLGYQHFTGNTNTEFLQYGLFYNYNRKWDYEWTFKFRSNMQKVDNNKYNYGSGSLRYGKSINKSWYWFYEYAAASDQLRTLESKSGHTIGTGYWFSDSADFKFTTEISVGQIKEIYTGIPNDRYTVTKIGERFIRKLNESLSFNHEFFYATSHETYEYYYDLVLQNQLNTNWSLEMAYEFFYKDKVPADVSRWDAKSLVRVSFIL
ncbi:DUF481 domain-containing protein [bacterium]|nr:DUF481 domain-containing protein [bacterium]